VNCDGRSTTSGSGRHFAAHLKDGDHHANLQDARNENPMNVHSDDDHHVSRDDLWTDYRRGHPHGDQIVSQTAVNAHLSTVT
jgi:hypothetical protein